VSRHIEKEMAVAWPQSSKARLSDWSSTVSIMGFPTRLKRKEVGIDGVD